LTIFLILIGFLYIIDQRYEKMSGNDGARQSLYNKLRQRQRGRMDLEIETRPEYMRILSAELTLVDIEIVRRELQQSASKAAYAGVYGVFCKVNFGVHKRDPSTGTCRSTRTIGSFAVNRSCLPLSHKFISFLFYQKSPCSVILFNILPNARNPKSEHLYMTLQHWRVTWTPPTIECLHLRKSPNHSI
jgi:hypothetical protein